MGLAATTLNVLVAVLIGGTSGFLGGKLDLVVQWFVDAWMSFPGPLLLLTIIAIVGQGLVQLIAVLSISGGIVGSRVLRSAVIGVKENDYFQSAERFTSPWRTPRGDWRNGRSPTLSIGWPCIWPRRHPPRRNRSPTSMLATMDPSVLHWVRTAGSVMALTFEWDETKASANARKHGEDMKKEPDTGRIDELREEYDFSGGVRGKYAERYGEGANIVILDPDVAKVFRDSKSVNEALRALVEVANKAAAAG